MIDEVAAGGEDMHVDGVPTDRLDVSDRGLHYGDGVFETITCEAGQPRWLDSHMRRLAVGCGRLGIDIDEHVDAARAEITAAAARGSRGIVKLIVTRGRAVSRGYAYTGHERTRRIVVRYPWPTETLPARARVEFSALRLGDQPRLAGIKHLNRLEQVLARREAQERGFDELLLCGTDGRLVSGTMTNVFLVKKGTLVTPKLDRAGVAGVMRALVLGHTRAEGWRVEERDVDLREAYDADEVFMTNVRVGLWSAGEIAGRGLDDFAVASALAPACGAGPRSGTAP